MVRRPYCFFSQPARLRGADLLHDVLSRVLGERSVKVVTTRALQAEMLFSELAPVSKAIQRADMVVADVTGLDPTVLYELGLAHAWKKRTLILSQDADGLPPDFAHFQVIVYGPGDRERLAYYIGYWADGVVAELVPAS